MGPYFKMSLAGFGWAVSASVINFLLSITWRNLVEQEYKRQFGHSGLTEFSLSLYLEALVVYPVIIIFSIAVIFPIVSALIKKIPKYTFAAVLAAFVGVGSFRATESFWLLTLLPTTLAFLAAIFTGRNGEHFVSHKADVPSKSASPPAWNENRRKWF